MGLGGIGGAEGGLAAQLDEVIKVQSGKRKAFAGSKQPLDLGQEGSTGGGGDMSIRKDGRAGHPS